MAYMHNNMRLIACYNVVASTWEASKSIWAVFRKWYTEIMIMWIKAEHQTVNLMCIKSG